MNQYILDARNGQIYSTRIRPLLGQAPAIQPVIMQATTFTSMPPLPRARRGTREYGVITLAMFFGGFATFSQLYSMQSLLPTLAQVFRITPAHSSWVVSSATIMLAVGLVIGGLFADSVSRKRLMVGALLASSLLSLAGAFAGLMLTLPDHLAFIVIGLALFTFCFFGAHAVASAWMGHRAREGRAIAASLYLFCYYVGSSLIGTGTGVIMHGFGWQGLAATLGVTMLVALWLVYRVRNTA
jgi:YNFM family putative membrane transporter